MLLCQLEVFGHTPQAKLRGRAYPKVYAADPGLVSAFSLARQPTEDVHVRARATEAAVFRHLRETARAKGGRCSYLRGAAGDSEIDFVITTSGQRVGFEVKSGLATENQAARFGAAVIRWKLDRGVLVHAGARSLAKGFEIVGLRDLLLDPSSWVTS
jgi:predicted AAA+ superfamily ATPase